MNNAIAIAQLVKDYGTNHVLKGIDLEVPRGQFLVILGPSGVGKSTLLRCMNRLVEPTSGLLQIAGFDATDAKQTRMLRQHVAMIFQNHNIVPRLSVLKNVLTGRLGSVGTWSSLFQLFRKSDVEIAMECLRRVELEHKANERADSLSGGQKQRVGIARALAQMPQVILADEPVASLDPKTSRIVLQYLKMAANDLGITVICNLHQVDFAKEFGDRIVGICDGKIAFDGTGDELTGSDLKRIYEVAPRMAKPVSEEDDDESVKKPGPSVLQPVNGDIY